VWLLVGLLVVVALVVSALFGLRILQTQTTKAPQRVSDQFISDLQKDDPVGAYGLTSASYQKTYSDVYFKKIVDQVSKGLQEAKQRHRAQGYQNNPAASRGCLQNTDPIHYPVH